MSPLPRKAPSRYTMVSLTPALTFTTAGGSGRRAGGTLLSARILLMLLLLNSYCCLHGVLAATTYARLTVSILRVINPEAQHGLGAGYCDGSKSAGCDIYFKVAV